MWNDNETSVDFIDFSHYIDAVCQIVENDDLLPCSIGIYGDWGSGKSSLMKMVEEKYKKGEQKDVLVIRFNGWLFEGFEDSKTVLMGRIISELSEHLDLKGDAQKGLKDILKKVDKMKVAQFITKHGLSAIATHGLSLPFAVYEGYKEMEKTGFKDVVDGVKDVEFKDYIKEISEGSVSSSIQNFHKDFDELLKNVKVKRIIVLIDDLDRCSPETIIGTLEAIKLFLFSSRTAFIIGADERLIKYAVEQRFPKLSGVNADVGRDYLEKLIQIPIRIPSLNSVEMLNYMTLLFCKLHLKEHFEVVRKKIVEETATGTWKQQFSEFKIVDLIFETLKNTNEKSSFESLKNDLSMSAQIARILATGLNGNPRQCKRYLNMLMLRSKMADAKKANLKKKVLAKLMLLEYLRPQIFSKFNEIQMANDGFITGIKDFENPIATGENKNNRKTTSKEKTETNLDFLADDAWCIEWIKIDPLLASEDLSPYFYFSRDKLSVLNTTDGQRMSPNAMLIYGKLKSESDSVKKQGFEESSTLNEADLSAVFEKLADDIYKYEGSFDGKSPVKILIEFAAKRKEVLEIQLGLFLPKLPAKKFKSSFPVLMETYFEQWKTNKNFHEIFDVLEKNGDNEVKKALSLKKYS
jgi:predicted KAP-like P-loop ATPase